MQSYFKSYFSQSFSHHSTQWTMIFIETIYSFFSLISSSPTYCSQNLIPRYLLSLASTVFLLLIQQPTGAKNPKKSIQYYIASFLNILALLHEIKLALHLDDPHDEYFLLKEEFKSFFRIDLLIEILWRILKFQPLSGGLINYLYISACLYTFYIISVSPESFACSLKFVSQAIFLSIILLYSHKKHHKPPDHAHHKHTQMLLSIFDYINEGTVVLDLKGEIKLFNKSLMNFFTHNVNKLTLEDLNNLFLDLKFIERSSSGSPLSPQNQSQENPSSLRASRRETSQILSQNFLPNSTEDSYFDEQAQGISCIKELFHFYSKLNQNIISTFRARIHHHHTQEWHNMEIKVYLLTDIKEKHLLLFIKDLTEFDRRSLSLEKEKLIYRDSLIASFSHELRTPLNSNLGFLEQSLDSDLISAEAKEKFIKPALSSGRLLFFIISDILDYSLILAHGLRLDITGQNLLENINSCVKLIQPKLVEKGLTFKFTIEGNIPQLFYTDHKRLSQIIINLFNNAIQFTMKGELEIIVTECLRNNIMISVKDTGIGMDESSQERLQNNLDQEELNQKVNDSSIGIGLGLFISNKLVKMLNQQRGGLKFRSVKDQGSIFSFEIKNQHSTIGDVENSPSNRLSRFEIEQSMNLNTKVRQYNTKEIKNIFKRRVSQGKVRVLVVDDEIFNIIVIENFCKALGIEVEKALNGKEAIEKLRVCAREENKAAIKMVFMDINMPVMDGYQATREVHKMIEDGEIEDVTVIGVTAYISWDKIEKGYRSGMAEILTKPISKEMIMEIFKKYRII